MSIVDSFDRLSCNSSPSGLTSHCEMRPDGHTVLLHSDQRRSNSSDQRADSIEATVEHSPDPALSVRQEENGREASIEDSERTPRFNKCAACFKQFKQKEFLLQHMERAGHSPHEPRCSNCRKHCRCLDALREHLLGPLAKKDCAEEFVNRGCSLCLEFFENADAAAQHRAFCQLLPPSRCEPLLTPRVMKNTKRVQTHPTSCPKQAVKNGRRDAAALDCEMVGGGQDGSLDICARLCLVDEDENILLYTYVKPQLPVTDFRFELTGITPENLADAMPVKVARQAVETLLYNGAKSWASRANAKFLVGHSLHHDLNCLGLDYPAHLQRDTAFYPPLLRTSNVCNKLQYLTKTYLGYQIQERGAHDPYEDAVAAMRLYRRMRMVAHPGVEQKEKELFSTMRRRDLERLSADSLLEVSVPRFQCWCLDG